MKKLTLFIFTILFTASNLFADNQLVSTLKNNIFEMSRNPFFQTKDQYNLAAAISNKGNTSDLSLRELYWNTYQLDSDLEKIIVTQKKDGSWPDIQYVDSARSNWSPTNHTSRLLLLGRAYITPSSKFYQQKKVSEVLHRGINYWFRTKPVCSNWWYNQIGIPRFMGLLFLFMEKELTATEKTEAVIVLNNSGFRMTGQNKVWQAGNVLLKALLIDDEALAKQCRDTIASEIYTTTKEGIQPDYSFHQHGPQQQFGNYGLAFLSSMTYYANVFGGTSLSFSPSQIDILRNYVLDGENWVSWRGYMDVSACNRQLFKQAQLGKTLALCIAVNQLKQADKVNSALYDNIINRNLQPGSVPEKPGAKHFWRSDLTVFRSATNYISVRCCSPRVKGTEFTNNENKKGHFISDGTTIFMRQGNEYLDIFPFWDWNRLPGITAPIVDVVKAHSKSDSYHNPNAFVGGLTHNNIGISTFHLDRNDINAKKSWFYLNNKLVCLGTDIKSKNDKEIVTSINQCLQKGKADISYYNDNSISANDTLLISNEIETVWHDSIGYYFPEKQSAMLSLKTQTGNWHEIADPYSSDKVSGKVFKLWINHGVISAAPKSYEYVVIPAISTKKMKQFVENPDIEILANQPDIQGVKLKDNTVFQFVFHKSGRMNTFSKTDFIESKTDGLVQLENSDQNVIITVSDPTQLKKSMKIIISGNYKRNKVVYNPDTNQTELKIRLPQGANAGKSVTIELKK
jgi:chondroitin AC lyase